jgi:hypothetical protein
MKSNAENLVIEGALETMKMLEAFQICKKGG